MFKESSEVGGQKSEVRRGWKVSQRQNHDVRRLTSDLRPPTFKLNYWTKMIGFGIFPVDRL